MNPPEMLVIALPGLAAGTGDGVIQYRPLEAKDFEIWSVAFALTTDATITTRVPFLQVGGQNRLFDIGAGQTGFQVQSLTRIWTFIAGISGSSGVDITLSAFRIIIHMPTTVIPAGYALNISMDGGQAGDIVSSVFVTGRYRLPIYDKYT